MGRKRKMTGKSISDAEFPERWRQLGHNQQRFAVAMLDTSSKKKAALSVGIEPDTAYHWGGTIDEVIAYLRMQAKNSAITILADTVVKAAMIKRTGLDSSDEKTRQDSAQEILDRVVGRPTSRQEITGKDGGPLEAVIEGALRIYEYPNEKGNEADSGT